MAGLLRLLRRPLAHYRNDDRSSGDQGNPSIQRLSLSDFGAGVGAYGHALLSIDPKLNWRGYDGACNVEKWSDGFVRHADLSAPLALPRTDWAMSLEVGEHLPNMHEAAFVRNLHAHNCHGIVLSWALIRQKGIAHINAHSRGYLVNALRELGYRLHEPLTKLLRNGEPALGMPRACKRGFCWLNHSLNVFERIEPVVGEGCTITRTSVAPSAK